MADAGNAILDILSNDGVVAGLVADRIYRDVLPSKPTYPAISFQLISTVAQQDHDGQTKNFRNIYQIDCWGVTSDIVSAIRDAVFNATDNQKGTFAGVNVLGLFFSDDRDLHDSEPDLFRRSIEEVMFIET